MNRQILRYLTVIILVWQSWASAFTDALKSAAEAVYNGTATQQQQALILMNYQKLNLMGLGGDGRGGLSDKVYQANQRLFAEFNDKVSRDTLSYMGMEGTLPDIKDRYKAGTDTDINVMFKNERSLRVKDLQEMRDYYNVAYRKHLEDSFDIRIDDDMNWAAHNETDFMPDTRHIDQQEFTQAGKFVNREGGWMYENPKAVQVEINKGKPGYKIDIEGAKAYGDEMLENIQKKSEKMAKHQAKLREAMNARNFAPDDATKRKFQMEVDEYRAMVQLDQSQMAKYMDRLDDLNQRLRKQNGLPDLPEPQGVEKLAGEVSAKRGPSTASKAMELAAKKEALQQHYVKNLSQTYTEIAATTADANLKQQYLQEAAEASQRHLTPDQQRQFVQDIQSTYGKNAPIAKELDLEVKRAKAKQQMASIAPAMKVVAGAGFVNDLFDICDAYQKGGIVNVAQTQAVNFVAGKLMETVTSRLVAAVPSAGPVMAVAGSGAVSYELTRNVMKRVTINGKTLDEHTQEGIDNSLFVSAADKQARDANLTKMLTRLVKNKKYNLPEGMTLAEARDKVLENADKGGPLFSFLDGAPPTPVKQPKKLTLDDIPLDQIEGRTPEEQQRDADLTQQLIKLIKGGRYALPQGMSITQARKLVLLNSRANKDKFGFLIDKEKERQAKLDALEKWKNNIVPKKPYTLISFRNQSFALGRNGLDLKARVVWSVDTRETRPEGGMILYRDGDEAAVVPIQGNSHRYSFKYEEDPMNKGKYLLYVDVMLTDGLAGLDDRLRGVQAYFYHMTWHLFDDQGKAKEILGSTEQQIHYAVFPGRVGSQPQILLCNDSGQPLEDNEKNRTLLEHLEAHFYALQFTKTPSRRIPDVEVYQVELPPDLRSTYRRFDSGDAEIRLYRRNDGVGTLRFSSQGELLGHNFNRRGLTYTRKIAKYNGSQGPEERLEIQENWFDDQGREHGPQRFWSNGTLLTDAFFKHGTEHGRQTKTSLKGNVQFIKEYKDGQRHGLYDERHYDADSSDYLPVSKLKTYYRNDIEIGPREVCYKNGNKGEYTELTAQDGQSIKHGRYQRWHEDGRLLLDESYRQGKLHGKSMAYSNNGDVMRETNYSDGLKQGEERLYRDNTQLKSVVPYDQDKPHGIAEHFHEQGQKSHQTLYRQGTRIGDLKRWRHYQKPADWQGPNTLAYEAQYDDSGCITQETEWLFDGDKPERKHLISYRPKGNLQVSRWVSSNDGKSVKHGVEQWYTGSQLVKEDNWQAGKRHGTAKRWYDNGRPQEEQGFKEDVKHGKHLKWDSHGNAILSATYENGLLVGEHLELGKQPGYDIPVFYVKHYEIKGGKSVPTGDSSSKAVKLVDGKYIQHGQTKIVEKGITVFTGGFHNGEPSGKRITVLANGVTETKRVVNGQLDGAYEERDAQGKIIKKAYYRMGQPDFIEQWGQDDQGLFYRKTSYTINDGQAEERHRTYYQYYLKDNKTVYHGVQEYHSSGKPTQRFTNKDGKKHGPFSEYHSGTNQVKRSGTYFAGKFHGEILEFQQDGSLSRRSQYSHGLTTRTDYFSGPAEARRHWQKNYKIVEDRQIAHGRDFTKIGEQMIEFKEYRDGQQHGIDAAWQEDGTLKYRKRFDRGIQVSLLSYNSSSTGRQKTEANWINLDGQRVKHGPQRQFKDDILVREEFYDQGKKTGTWKECHADGQPQKITVYQQDKKVEEANYYADDKGKVSNQCRYDENENVIERTSYSRYDGHEYKTVTPLQRINGKNVEHGVVKRYCDGTLERETKYENGEVVDE